MLEGEADGIVPQDRDSDGHNTVILEGPDGPVVERVCDLVARSFLGPCPQGHRVEHVNGDLSDDRAANLRYVATVPEDGTACLSASSTPSAT